MPTPKFNRADPILWALKLSGPIENADGRATNTLREDIESNGIVYGDHKSFSDTVGNLVQKGFITSEKNQMGRSTQLALSETAELSSENPFDFAPLDFTPQNGGPRTSKGAKVAPKAKSASGKFDHIIALPITERLELISVLSRTVAEDMQTFKNDVVKGL